MYCSIRIKGLGGAGVEPLFVTVATRVRFPASAYGTSVVFFGYSGFFHHVIPRKPTYVLSGSRSYVHKFHEFPNIYPPVISGLRHNFGGLIKS